jgi:hypothetical protein
MRLRYTARYILMPLAYLLWITNCALALLAVVLARQVVLRLAVILHWDRYAVGSIDKVGLLILGTAWLGWAIFAEQWYRTAAASGAGTLARTTWRSMMMASVPIVALVGTLTVMRR